MTEVAGQPESGDMPQVSRSRRGWVLAAIVAVALIAAGVVAGLLIGNALASSRADRDEQAADRASTQEDAARDRRDRLDTHIAYLDDTTGKLDKVASSPPLVGSKKTTTNAKPGATFAVDGARYTVNGIQLLDEFTSTDAARLATAKKGYRWALVDLDYTNLAIDSAAPTCGTLGVVHLILDDRSVVSEVSSRNEKPPVAPGSFAPCGTYVDRGQTVRWVAPVRVPDHVKIAGLLIADVYARTSHSSFNVIAGKQAWLPLAKPLETGESGDKAVELKFGGDS